MSGVLQFRDDSQIWVNRLLCEGLPRPMHTGEAPRVTFDIAWGKKLSPGQVIDIDMVALKSLETRMGGDDDSYNRIDLHVMPRASNYLLNRYSGSYIPGSGGMKLCSNSPKALGKILAHENRHRHQFDQGAKIDFRYVTALKLMSVSKLIHANTSFLLFAGFTGLAESFYSKYSSSMAVGGLALAGIYYTGFGMYWNHHLEVDARMAQKKYDASNIFWIL